MLDLFLPNRKVLTDFYLPVRGHIPPGSRPLLRPFVFLAVDGRGSAEDNETFSQRVVLWALTGNSSQAGDAQAGGFRVQLYHTHAETMWTKGNKPIAQNLGVGTAQNPMILRDPELFEIGDSLTCEVKNLDASANRIEVVAWLAVLP